MKKADCRDVCPCRHHGRRAEQHHMNTLGERYVRLVLAMGQHDADYVDAYYGPPEWRTEADAAKVPLDGDRDARVGACCAISRRPRLRRRPTSSIRLRHGYLARQLEALRARASMLTGRKLGFDEESKALYDAVAPMHGAAEFQRVLDELEKKLPGQGSLIQRYDEFRSGFIIPKERLDAMFKAAIDGCRIADAAAHHASGRRELHRRVRHRQELERLQLVSGQLSQPDPGEHRPADLHRPGDRPGVPRGLSRPSRLQRAAREEPGARSRLDGILRVSALLAAVAHCRRHRQLRHRRRLSARPSASSSSGACCFRRRS